MSHLVQGLRQGLGLRVEGLGRYLVPELRQGLGLRVEGLGRRLFGLDLPVPVDIRRGELLKLLGRHLVVRSRV